MAAEVLRRTRPPSSAAWYWRVCIGSACMVAPLPNNRYRPYLLRHPILAFVSAFLLVAKVVSVGLLALTPDVARLSTISGSFLVQQTNAARADIGLPALAEHPLLVRAARAKADDMLKNDYFEHTSPSGATPWAWFDGAGYQYVYAGENLAIDFSTGEAVHAAWMKSAGHRRNIESDKYRHIGIAVVTGEFQGRTTTVVVQHFGSLSSELVARGVPRAAPTPAPTATPALPPTPRAAPEALEPPAILEPSEGQLLPSGAATVRGTAERDGQVELLLDDTQVGSFPTRGTTFAGTFTPPSEEERPAVLTATVARNGRTSPPSRPRHVQIDTKGPTIRDSRAVVLPDPRGTPGHALVAIPIDGAPAHVWITLAGTTYPMTVRGAVALVTAPTDQLGEDGSVRAIDGHGNVRVAPIRQTREFRITPRTAGEQDTRAGILQAAARVKTLTAVVLAVTTVLLALNIFIYMRIQHPDLIAHALFVIGLGIALVVIT